MADRASTKPGSRPGLWQSLRTHIAQWRLGSQLTLILALGMFAMVVAVSVGTTIIISQSMTQNFIQNGKNVTGVLAVESALPVLLGSPEGASQAIAVASTFPSVVQAAVYELDGNPLAQSGRSMGWESPPQLQEEDDIAASLERDSGQHWQFVAAVYAENTEPGLDDIDAQQVERQRIGSVRVLISKEPLFAARDNIIAGNIFVLLTVALLLVGALNRLSLTLTRPLRVFVETMSAGAKGEQSNIRVSLTGSEETQLLSGAFNQMMQVLEDRESELATTRDRALAAAKLKSEFAANVSHEIRTPLNGIIGTLNLLSDSEISAKQRELLSLAESSSESLMRMINDILDFSRLSLDQSTINATEFDLYQLLEELLVLHAHAAGAQALDMLLYYDPLLPRLVESDPNKLRQLLNNLINNAVKFTDRGEIIIAARTETDEQGKIWIRLSVKDSGIGIAEQDLRTVFMPYAQSDGSMSRKYSGTGLGLAISEKLAELLRGDIGVHSELDVGSEFYLRIPFRYRMPQAQLPPAVPQQQKILAFGSSEALCEASRNIFELQGWQAEVYTDLQQMLLVLEQLDLFEAEPLLAFFIGAAADSENLLPAMRQMVERFGLDAIVVGADETIASALGGRIEWLPAPLRQAALELALARLQGQEAQLDQPQASDLQVSLQGRRVLLVEDNIVNQRVARAMLEKVGCDVSVAENGLEALEVLASESVELVFMDCQMPKMNGYDATRALRQLDGESAQVPVVAMTANAGPHEKAHCFDVGMNDFLGKPVKLRELIAVTAKWLGDETDRDATTAAVPRAGTGDADRL